MRAPACWARALTGRLGPAWHVGPLAEAGKWQPQQHGRQWMRKSLETEIPTQPLLRALSLIYKFQLGANCHVFAIDLNGYVLFHPNSSPR